MNIDSVKNLYLIGCLNYEGLKELYSVGDISDEDLKGLVIDGTITMDELSGIIMTDKKILELFNPNTKKVKDIPKWHWAPSDGRYHITLDGKQYPRTHKKDLDKILLDWYHKNFDSNKTVKHYFEVFCEMKQDTGEANSENTIKIYHDDFKRFLTPIADRNINSISEKELKILLNDIAKTETKNG